MHDSHLTSGNLKSCPKIMTKKGAGEAYYSLEVFGVERIIFGELSRFLTKLVLVRDENVQ